MVVQALGMDPVESRRQRCDVVGPEDATDDGVALLSVVLNIAKVHLRAASREPAVAVITKKTRHFLYVHATCYR